MVGTIFTPFCRSPVATLGSGFLFWLLRKDTCRLSSREKNRRQGSVVIGMGGFLTPIPNYTTYHYLFCYI